MNQINIVVLGASTTSTDTSKVPTIEDIKKANLYLLELNIQLNLYLVDDNFHYSLMNSKYHSSAMRDEGNLLLQIEELPYSIEIVTMNYFKWDKDSLDVGIPTIYLSYLNFKNNYELLNYIELYVDVFTCNTTEYIPLLNVIQSYLSKDNELVTQVHLLFNASKLPRNLPNSDRMYIKEMLLRACNLASSYIQCNFHIMLPENSVPPIKLPNWMYNVETPVLKGLILYYGIHSDIPDQSNRNLMINSYEFRHKLCFTLISFMSNFLVNNDIIDTQDISSWYSASTWSLAKIKLIEW